MFHPFWLIMKLIHLIESIKKTNPHDSSSIQVSTNHFINIKVKNLQKFLSASQNRPLKTLKSLYLFLTFLWYELEVFKHLNSRISLQTPTPQVVSFPISSLHVGTTLLTPKTIIFKKFPKFFPSGENEEKGDVISAF